MARISRSSRVRLGVSAALATALLPLGSSSAAAATGLGAPDVKLVTPSVLQHDGSFALRQTWKVPAELGALCSQEWQYFAPSPDPEGWDWYDGSQLAPAARSYTSTMWPTEGLQFTVWGRTCKGTQVEAEGRPFSTSAPNQDVATFSGRWSTRHAPTAYQGDLATSSTRGASATYRGTWSNLGIVAAKGPKGGKATVHVDGRVVATVNLYAPTAQARQVVFKTGFAGSAARTVRIVNTSTSTTRNQVALDGFAQIVR